MLMAILPICIALSVWCESVTRGGCGRLLDGARARRRARVFRGGFGSFASVAVRPFKGKLVRVVGATTIVDEDVLLATLESDPTFTRPDAQGDHSWHAVKTAHRTRLMRGRDATCERWGCLLHKLFDANPTRPHRYVARLFVREAGLGGEASERQSAILDEITRFLLEELGKKAFCRRGSKRTRPLLVAAMGDAARGVN